MPKRTRALGRRYGHGTAPLKARDQVRFYGTEVIGAVVSVMRDHGWWRARVRWPDGSESVEQTNVLERVG